MEEHELAVLNAAGELVELRTSRKPDTVLAEAALVSKALARYAEEHGLYKKIGASKHLQVEGWQMCGAMYRVTTRSVETRLLDMGNGVRGFESVAEAVYVPTGTVIGRADAMCLSDEENWGLRPKYEWIDGKKTQVALVPVPLQQLRSMAQTRAQSKALASIFKWVAKIGGFSGTPAEEMTGHEQGGDPGPGGPGGGGEPRQPQKKQPAGGDEVISEAQGKRLYALARQAGLDEEGYRKFLARFGYQRTAEVKRSEYERLCAEVQKSDAAE